MFASRHAYSPQSPVPPAPSVRSSVVDPAPPRSSDSSVWQVTRWRPRCLRVAAGSEGSPFSPVRDDGRLCWPLIPVPRRVVESFSLVLWWFLVLTAGFLTICSPNWRTGAGVLVGTPASLPAPAYTGIIWDRVPVTHAASTWLANIITGRVRARPATERWVSPQMGSSSTFGERGAMRHHPLLRSSSLVAIPRLLGHAEISP